MCMINRKDDNAVFLIPSCHQCPLSLCVLTDLWLKGRLEIHPAVKMPLSNTVLTPHTHTLYMPVRLSVRFLLDLLFCRFGSFFRAHRWTDKDQTAFLFSPLCVFNLGSRKTQIRPPLSALAEYESVYHCLSKIE